ncbi:hypothetical protein N475_25295 [Pseudoalteromonas luteoviolacea DSM 6061]|uniref:Uncharacterized protein n=1 Tax=Pseudoalteromonas luteoviolacea DSM 6061 TaxID=1365250 RepID=A0A166UDG7_9GAMM|nr:hypothetical protein N475_25295 [Pseudoalteromonas luteoviolacea DSM 6061]
MKKEVYTLFISELLNILLQSLVVCDAYYFLDIHGCIRHVNKFFQRNRMVVIL